MRRALILGIGVWLVLSTVLAVSHLGSKRHRGILGKVYAHDGCNLRTLRGGYGAATDGLITAGGSPPVSTSATIPIAVMSRQTFDGAGNFSTSNTSNLGGLVFTATGSGTYTVNADCTGTITALLTNGETIHSSFVIVDGGRQLLSVSTDSFVVGYGTATRIEKPEE
jgi:hypothetical protein